jgi:zinc/manganese transport system permease protein
VPVRALSAGFLVLLGAAVAEASQITGTLLVFALLVMPAATAQALTARPSLSLLVSVALAVAITWLGLGAAYYSSYPIGFFITTLGFLPYALARLVRRARPAGSRA